MKLIFHFLRHDWRRWRFFLIALWVLLAAYAICAAGMAQMVLDPPENPRWVSAMPVIGLLIVGCAGIVCLLAGGSDSPARGESWMHTRPRHPWAGTLSRVLLVAAGGLVPLAAAQGLILYIFGFDVATVAGEARNVWLLAAALAGHLMLLAFIRPWWPGFALGFLISALLTLMLVRGYGGFPAARGASLETSATLAVMMLALVPGIRTRRQSSRNGRALTAVLMGGALPGIACLMVMTGKEHVAGRVAAASAAGEVIEYRKIAQLTPLTGRPDPVRNGTWVWSGEMEMPDEPVSPEWTTFDLTALAWRRDSQAAWSEWREIQGSLTAPGAGGSMHIKFFSGEEEVAGLAGGELQFKTTVFENVRENYWLPLEEGAILRGSGWVIRVNSVFPENESIPGCTILVSSIPGCIPPYSGRSGTRQWPDYPKHYAGSLHTLRIPGVQLSKENLLLHPPGPGNAQTPLPQSVGFTSISTVRRDGIAHISNLTLSVPARRYLQGREAVHPQALEKGPARQGKPEAVSPPDPWASPYDLGAPWPWPGPEHSYPGPPGNAGTPESLAIFADRIADKFASLSRTGSSPDFSNDRRAAIRTLAGLVPGREELFVELAGRRGGIVVEGLKEGLAIWPAPALSRSNNLFLKMELARRGGWMAEMKEELRAAGERTGGQFQPFLRYCRQYRDPVFHPLLRRLFSPDVATVRYWESMPDLAPDLPAFLAAGRELLMSNWPAAPLPAGFLYAGDLEVLGLLLDRINAPVTYSDVPADLRLLWRWVRDERGGYLPRDQRKLIAWCQSATGADFRFDRWRRLFFRNSAPAAP